MSAINVTMHQVDLDLNKSGWFTLYHRITCYAFPTLTSFCNFQGGGKIDCFNVSKRYCATFSSCSSHKRCLICFIVMSKYINEVKKKNPAALQNTIFTTI